MRNCSWPIFLHETPDLNITAREEKKKCLSRHIHLWILLPSCGYWCSSCTTTFPWNSQECGGAWCKNLPAQVNILCFFWTQAPTGCETVLTWATSLPKSEYCTIVGLLRLRPWWWFFSGITLPTRWAECLGRKAVGQWTIIRAVATPYPKSIPSHPIPSWKF